MKPVKQTRPGGPDLPPEDRGDCWDACLASLLEVPIEDVIVPHSDDPEQHWWTLSQAALKPHGYTVVYASTTYWPDGYWIAGVPSLNHPEGVNHVVVMHDGHVVHDPSNNKTYPLGAIVDDLAIISAFVLAPLDPTSLRKP